MSLSLLKVIKLHSWELFCVINNEEAHIIISTNPSLLFSSLKNSFVLLFQLSLAFFNYLNFLLSNIYRSMISNDHIGLILWLYKCLWENFSVKRFITHDLLDCDLFQRASCAFKIYTFLTLRTNWRVLKDF